ncbi:unknown protein (Partial), partial [Seminavis robusta]|eukprot:Sro1999_g310130.1 n/a (994) ;mRNA; r:766-3748
MEGCRRSRRIQVRRSKSCVDLRNLFDSRPSTPTDTTENESSDSSNDNKDALNNQDFSDNADPWEAFLSSLQETIGCRPRKKGTPLFDFVADGNDKLSFGWLRNALITDDSESPRLLESEKKMMVFIFMSLSGVGRGEDGSSPTEVLSFAWGMSKPAIRRACSSVLGNEFLSWLTSADSSTEISDEDNKKRPVRSDPSEQSTAQVFSPALVDRNPKRQDVRATPSVFIAAGQFASPDSTLSPAQSTCSPVTYEFSSPTLPSRQNASNEWEQENNRTRLDFNLAHKVHTTTQTDDSRLDDLLLGKIQLLADIEDDGIGREAEEAICRAVGFLLKRKRDSLIQYEAEADNEHESGSDGCNNLPRIMRAALEASAEFITLRSSNGNPIKIMRIKETRQGAGDKKGRKLRAKGHLVEALLSNLGVTEEESLSLLQTLGNRRGLRVLKEIDCGLDIAQCAALMLYLPVTARGLERLQRFMKWALPSIGPSMFPVSLRKNIAKYSMDVFNLKLGFELVSLEIGGSTRNERCLHVWIKEPAIAVERLTQSALIAGKFEESSLFSNHKEEVVIVQGSDRGGDITANLIRLANRCGGNSSQHCLPLSFYEYGKESYFNLKATIFNPHKPTREFLQSMLNKEYQMIAVTIHNGSSGAVVGAQCKMLRFLQPEGSSGQLSVILHQDEAEADNISIEEEGSLPRSVRIVTLEEEGSLTLDQDPTRISLQLVVSSAEEPISNDDDDNANEGAIIYKGFVLRNCFGREISRNSFTDDLVAASGNTSRVRYLQCRCFTSDDIKCNTTLMGQGTAAVMCPCTICIARKKEFASYLTAPPNEQAPNREGDLANPNVYEAFIADAKGLVEWVRLNSAGRARALKLKYHSVVHEPLLYTMPELNSCSGMHVSSGLLTHCTLKVLEYLGELDKSTPWLMELTDMVEEAKQYVRTATDSTEKLRKTDAKIARDIKAAASMAPMMVKQLQAERETISSKLRAETKARDAAKLFIEKG